MAYTLEFVKTARLELVDITEYIALDSVANAENFVSLLIEKYTSTLSQFPESGRTHKDDIRKISFRGYTAFYKVDIEKRLCIFCTLLTKQNLLKTEILRYKNRPTLGGSAFYFNK